MVKQILPVAIIGGGPVGLVSSIMLSMLKIPHCVFERFPGTSIHPKACGLNQQSVELFRRIGIEKEFKKHRAPAGLIAKTGWFTGLGSNDREILVRDAWGGGKYAAAYKEYSPVNYSVLPQIRLEPLLQQRALELDPTVVQYNRKVINLVENDQYVSLKIQKRDGTTEEVKAQYVLAADGGRGMAEVLDIGWEGERDIQEMITIHFKADIRRIHPNPDVFISWLINPRMRGSMGTGYVFHLGPYDKYNASHNERDISNEYVLAAPKISDDPAQFDKAATVSRVRKSLGLPDLDIEIISTSKWVFNARVTERYRSQNGRVFLVSDACHRVPPWGALGLNTGLGDAQNLIWKLALALNSRRLHEHETLLDSYEIERKPIATRVAQNSLQNMRNHASVIDTALGITPHTTTNENIAAINAYFDPSYPEHKIKRANIVKAAKATDHEFNAPGIELGWFYPSVDTEGQGEISRHGGQLKSDGSFDITMYHPSTIPGHNLPHVWVKRGNEMVSTRDLVRFDRFILITGNGKLWRRFANKLIEMEVIGDGVWMPVDGRWDELRGMSTDGAILVRPDGIIAWRMAVWKDEFVTSVGGIFENILGGTASTCTR